MQKDNYEFDILVHGKPVQEYYHNTDQYIEGKEGTEFSLRLKNNSGKKALFVPTIDGLSVMDGEEASFKSTGYIVGPYSSETIDGWRTSDSEVAKFFFSKVKDSYAARTEKGGNVGIIGCAVFKEKYKAPEIIVVKEYVKEKEYVPYPVYPREQWPRYPQWFCANAQQNNVYMCSAGVSSLANNVQTSDSLGTGFGEAKYSPVHTVEFDKEEHPTAVIEIHYNTRENLAAMGVEFKRPLYAAISAFPKEEKYCKRPKDR